MLGADVATMPFKVLEQLYKHPLTDAGLERFLADWKKTGKTLRRRRPQASWNRSSPAPALPPGRLYRFAWGLYLVLALAGVLWIGFRAGRIPLSLFFDRERWWLDLALGVGGGARCCSASGGAPSAPFLWRGSWRRGSPTRSARSPPPRRSPSPCSPASPRSCSSAAPSRGRSAGPAATRPVRPAAQRAGQAFRLWTLFALAGRRAARRADGLARQPAGAGRRPRPGQRRQPPAPRDGDSARLPRGRSPDEKEI